MLTVTWQLKPLVVTLHLLFGMTTLGLLWWLWLTLDADIPLGEIRSMQTHMGSQTADTRFTAVLLGLFAGLGTILAVTGAYGVVAYLVAQRTQELGVRLALGASSTDILWLVLQTGLFIGLAGVALGLAGAMVARRLLQRFLYGVTASDP